MKLAASMAVVFLCVPGCASRPDLQSGWYLEPITGATSTVPGGTSSTTQGAGGADLYIALINRGHTSYALKCVVVNRTAEGGGWVYKSQGEKLEPGQIEVISGSHFVLAAGGERSAQPCPSGKNESMFLKCVVPVRVDVVDVNDVVIHPDHTSGLPSVLPGSWQSCPAATHD
ncbi:hypothetical protein [Paraburkholderia acidiphila]|uniref:Uncharacterized protein n=1 Tax=Paraburkholderia acidiphila TaxID=2571747 RepID=A0A7Z2GC91_9BURK|nr:hypothetical protein [Paraburkholderia acidiphila]QGZ58654.1 hypothetical protein FAZ97_27140 [Paraburkholderia acidiphila]